MTCQHRFEVHTAVELYVDAPGEGNIRVSGKCSKCGLPLVFKSGNTMTATPIGVGKRPTKPLPGQPIIQKPQIVT